MSKRLLFGYCTQSQKRMVWVWKKLLMSVTGVYEKNAVYKNQSKQKEISDNLLQPQRIELKIHVGKLVCMEMLL